MPLDWSAIETVLLDMDGTLLDLAFDRWFWQEHLPFVYARHHQLPEDQGSQELLDRIDAHMGTLQWYSLDFWQEQTGLDIAALKHEARDRIALRPQALDFLSALEKTGKQIILATNAHPAALAIKLDKTGIDSYFDAIVSSADYAAAKEEQAFWQRLQDEHPFHPASTLLVDDSLNVLGSAKRYGIGHLCCIKQPDSGRPPRPHTEPFHCVDNLVDALP